MYTYQYCLMKCQSLDEPGTISGYFTSPGGCLVWVWMQMWGRVWLWLWMWRPEWKPEWDGGRRCRFGESGSGGKRTCGCGYRIGGGVRGGVGTVDVSVGVGMPMGLGADVHPHVCERVCLWVCLQT